MAVYTIKAGDNLRIIYASLFADGVPFVLTAASVRLVARRGSDGTSSSIAATIVNPTAGRVSADVSSLLATPDRFALEFEVTIGSGIYTFPSDNYDTLNVPQDLD